MSTQSEREAVASLLMEYVKNNDVTKIEKHMSHYSEDSQWRDIVRYEFNITELLETTLLYDVVIPRLLAYEISTLSPFHYAAFKGHNDILVNFIDHDVPVDVGLGSGTTVLHLAAFGGNCDSLRMLTEVYKADIDKQDKYGWCALHYASTEGHLDAVRALLEMGVNSHLRDQDGTSAAFRAQVNGFQEIADLLCEEEDDLLNIDPAYEGRPPPMPEEGLYSKVNQNRSQSVSAAHDTKSGMVSETNSSILRDKSTATKQKRAQSEIVSSKSYKKSSTLPVNFMKNKTATVRRIIRKELEAAMDDETADPAYMKPMENTADDGADPLDKFALAGVGVNTLKGIMREEVSRITKEMFQRSQSLEPQSSFQMDKSNPIKTSSDYEDIYETVKSTEPLSQLPEEENDVPEIAPPLPPRNQDMTLPRGLKITGDKVSSTESTPKHAENLVLQKPFIPRASENIALKESIKRIAPILGSEWKRLAFELPLENTQKRVQDRVSWIEKRHPTDINKQAAMALAEWQINKRNSADIDALIIGLRKCGLNSLIEQVERVSQEFTA